MLLLFLLLAPLLALAEHDSLKRTASSDWKVKRSTPNRPQAPDISVGGVELAIHHQTLRANRKRDSDNGSIIAFAEESSTFIIPVALGAVAYPLQLDTSSADLLVASKTCDKSCPASTTDNPYYDPQVYSSSFSSVNDNTTLFASSFGDGTTASGLVARERIGIANVTVDDQSFGLINATNLTLAEQKASGIIGLGFPRLSVIVRALLNAETNDTFQQILAVGAVTTALDAGGNDTAAPTSTLTDAEADAENTATVAINGTAATATAVIPSATQPSAYLPPLLESLVRTPKIPYPVFAIALSPPASGIGQELVVDSPRYNLHHGSLTLGGVSAQYVSDDPDSGRTVNDIEWHGVVPFSSLNDTVSIAASATGSSSSNDTEATDTAATEIDATATEPSPEKAVVATPTLSAAGSDPTATADLEKEEYLYWALELSHVSVNGTDLGLNSTYASVGVPSIALLDIGNNGIYGPQQDVEALFKLIPLARQVNTGQWAVPCTTRATLSFSFGGRYVVLQPNDWMYAAVAGSSMCLAWPVASPDQGDGIDWTLGTPFLRNIYSIFSYGINGVLAPSVGFLPLPTNATQSQNLENGNATSSVSAAVATNGNASNPTPTAITPASLTATIQTTLPNLLLAGPDFATPTYLFATPVLSAGVIQDVGLANATAYQQAAVPVASLSLSQTTDPSVIVGWPAGSTDQVSGAAGGTGPAGMLIVAAVVAGWVLV